MKFKEYAEDKLLTLVVGAVSILLTLILVYLYTNRIEILLLVAGVLIVPAVMLFIYNYHCKKQYIEEYLDYLEKLDKKYLIHELTRHLPDNNEGRILNGMLYEINKSMIDNVNDYKIKSQDFAEFVELWVHEVKVPLASAKMIAENNRDVIDSNLVKELDRVDNYVEQALYYIRSNSFEKDYIVKKYVLSEIVKPTIAEMRSSFIEQSIKLELNDLDVEVITDIKWMRFILIQLISNSLKYSRNENPLIRISAETSLDGVTLKIYDNGMGIAATDIHRVFEKGFTGENGRIMYKATGIGLYLCKKLCDKLYHKISIESKKGEYTCVSIFFPKGRMTEMD